MALPSSGAISTDQIMNELGIAVQPREWGALWALAINGSTPKNKANAGGPYVLPNDWYGYSHDTLVFILTAGNSTSTSNSFSWNNVVDQENGAYHVYRDNVIIANLAGDIYSYVDTGLSPNTAYSYWIIADNSFSDPNSYMSNNVLMITLLDDGEYFAFDFNQDSLSANKMTSCSVITQDLDVVYTNRINPVIDTVFYNDRELTEPFFGGNNYINCVNNNISYLINDFGQVKDIYYC